MWKAGSEKLEVSWTHSMAKTICQTVQITTNETLRHKIYPWLEMKEDDINSLYWSITIKQRDIWEDERRNTRLYYPIYPTLYTPEAARTALHSERGGHKIAGACVSVGGVGGGVVVGGWVFSPQFTLALNPSLLTTVTFMDALSLPVGLPLTLVSSWGWPARSHLPPSIIQFHVLHY